MSGRSAKCQCQQGVGETPSIELVVFDTAGGLALSVGLSALGVQWINLHAGFQQLLDARALAGLNRERRRQRSAFHWPNPVRQNQDFLANRLILDLRHYSSL
jgi:hypothetical protein